jgi:hypothetical protein
MVVAAAGIINGVSGHSAASFFGDEMESMVTGIATSGASCVRWIGD